MQISQMSSYTKKPNKKHMLNCILHIKLNSKIYILYCFKKLFFVLLHFLEFNGGMHVLLHWYGSQVTIHNLHQSILAYSIGSGLTLKLSGFVSSTFTHGAFLLGHNHDTLSCTQDSDFLWR